jgi:integrase/recombinase XerD
MDTTTRSGSPLRQRMLENMRMRKLEPRIQEG